MIHQKKVFTSLAMQGDASAEEVLNAIDRQLIQQAEWLEQCMKNIEEIAEMCCQQNLLFGAALAFIKGLRRARLG